MGLRIEREIFLGSLSDPNWVSGLVSLFEADFPQKYCARPIFGFVYCDVYVVGDGLNESRGGLRRNSKKSLRRNSKKSAILRWAFFLSKNSEMGSS